MSTGNPGVPQFHRGLARERDQWLDDAACKDVDDPEMFFDPERYKYAQLICMQCTVVEQCAARRRPGYTGVWGGRIHEKKNPRYSKKPDYDHEAFPHGTERGYQRHIRNNQPACVRCRQAATAAREARRNAR